MTEFTIANIAEKDDIIDFINYVFSHAHKPHDFKSLVPKSYADNAINMGAAHYLAKEEGKIRALVANRIIEVSVCGEVLKFGLIGNVAVHPYSRGSGYMKQLLSTAIEDAKNAGVDLLVLGGQRQRYGYFGFENAGTNLNFSISKDNIRHCCSAVDSSSIFFKPMEQASQAELDTAYSLYESRPFHALRSRDEYQNIMRTWNQSSRILYKGTDMLGYVYGACRELVLRSEDDLPLALKAIFAKDNLDQVSISVAPYQNKRIRMLTKLCETSSIEPVEMIRVLNWQRVLNAFLMLKSEYHPLQDGDMAIRIDSDAFHINVTDGVPSVNKIHAASITMSGKCAHQVFFGLNSLLYPHEYYNWFPLPFTIDSPDTY